jgi:phosphate uptake regulator
MMCPPLMGRITILNEMWTLRSLERIDDHVCNIAEHVVYLVRGLGVRHGGLQDDSNEKITGPE